MEYWKRYMENGDEIGYGDLKYEDTENWEQLKKEIEGQIIKGRFYKREGIY